MQQQFSTLVLGYGNSSYGDDGLGARAIAYLKSHALEDCQAGVMLMDGGTAVFELLQYVEPCERLIVIDAARLAAEPGTVRYFLGADMDWQLGCARHTAHEVALRDILHIARLRETLPEQRALIGVQPKNLDFKVGLSPEVERSLPLVRDHVLRLLRGDWS